jgi:hypothetical protein
MAIDRTHDVPREGVVAGFIGATAVAMWFLILDTIQGRPFHTPSILGEALFSLLGLPQSGTITYVAVYTIFHYAAFALTGILLVFLIHKSRRIPSILAGLLLGFVVFEMGFYFLSALLSAPTLLGDIAWYQIAIGNLLAAAGMSLYLVRTHPFLTTDLNLALRGEDD